MHGFLVGFPTVLWEIAHWHQSERAALVLLATLTLQTLVPHASFCSNPIPNLLRFQVWKLKLEMIPLQKPPIWFIFSQTKYVHPALAKPPLRTKWQWHQVGLSWDECKKKLPSGFSDSEARGWQAVISSKFFFFFYRICVCFFPNGHVTYYKWTCETFHPAHQITFYVECHVSRTEFQKRLHGCSDFSCITKMFIVFQTPYGSGIHRIWKDQCSWDFLCLQCHVNQSWVAVWAYTQGRF